MRTFRSPGRAALQFGALGFTEMSLDYTLRLQRKGSSPSRHNALLNVKIVTLTVRGGAWFSERAKDGVTTKRKQAHEND